MTDTDMLYMASLEKRNEELKAKVAELEGKHWNECGQIAHYDDELKDLREENKVLMQECDRLIKEKGKLLSKVSGGDVLRICQLEEQLEKAKRLLKAAVEDFTAIAEVRAAATPILCPKYYETYMKAIDVRTRKWRYADEALALIGEDTNVLASKDDTNVGGKIDSWISCKDNMPDTLERGLSTMYSDCCLVCDAFGWVGMAYYITDGQNSWWEFADAQNQNKIDWTEVTHWQPLPEPPKE